MTALDLASALFWVAIGYALAAHAARAVGL